MASSRNCQLDITFPRHTMRNTVPRPPQPLRITYSPSPLSSPRPRVAGSTVPTAAATWSIAGDFCRIETQLSTGFHRQAAAPFAVAADKPPRQAKLSALLFDPLEQVLLEGQR